MELELKRGGRTARVETLGGDEIEIPVKMLVTCARTERPGILPGRAGAGVHLGGRSGLLAGAQSPAVSHCGDAEGGKDPL